MGERGKEKELAGLEPGPSGILGILLKPVEIHQAFPDFERCREQASEGHICVADWFCPLVPWVLFPLSHGSCVVLTGGLWMGGVLGTHLDGATSPRPDLSVP